MPNSTVPATTDTRPKRTSEVVAYIRRAGGKGVQLSKGQGVFCFEGPPTEDWIDHTVHVMFLADLTLEQWLQTFRAMDSNPANRRSVQAISQ